MAMSLSHPNPTDPYPKTGVKLGDEQFALAEDGKTRGLLALVRHRSRTRAVGRLRPPRGRSRSSARSTRSACATAPTSSVEGYDFAPTFSIWTTIEECLNPPIIWEKDRGWYTTEPFSEPETFVFPGGIGPIECVNVEHEEVVLMPRWIDAGRVTFKYGLGDEFIGVLKTLHKLGLDCDRSRSRSETVTCPRATSSPPACRTLRRSATR